MVDRGGFKDCILLISVVLPNLYEIGQFGFKNCSSLTEFEAPNLILVKESAF